MLNFFKIVFLLIFGLIISLNSQGQNELQKEILNYNDTRYELVTKGRRLMIDRLLAGDLEKTKQVRNYLISEVENHEYIALYPAENWLLMYWTQEYFALTSDIRIYETVKDDYGNGKRHPQEDYLLDKLVAETKNHIKQLTDSISQSSLEDSEKDFLIMNLHYLVSDVEAYPSEQEDLNLLADNYLLKYPNSSFATFTREYIRYKHDVSPWSFAAEFFSGYGFQTRDLNKQFGNNIPIGVAFDIGYKNFVLYLRYYIGLANTKFDTAYSVGVWESGSQVRVFLPEASLGYKIYKSERLNLVPFLGVSSTSISPTEYDLKETPELEELEIPFCLTYTFGLNLDIKLGEPLMPLVSFNGEDSYRFLRVRYSCNIPQFERKIQGISGQIHAITIGFNW